MDLKTRGGQVHKMRGKRGAAIIGICGDARLLQVSRQHLWEVLHGRRKSKPLLQRYQALQRTRTEQAA